VYRNKGETMMYGNKLAAAIKVNGKVLREFKDTVYIPFGAEYTILIKNLNTVQAVVNVFIDGDNVVPGGLVIRPGQEVDLERSIKNGNLTDGNRFKFIERTENIENGPRGIKLEDGLIRIEHQFEIPRPIFNIADINCSASTWPTYGNDRFSVTASGATYSTNVGGMMRGVDYSKGEATKSAASKAINTSLQSMGISASIGEVHDGQATMDSYCDTGITVPGSHSTQKFQTATIGALDPTKHSIVVKLLGDLGDNKPVTKAVTVKHKQECVTCGKLNKATSKFCTECGTALEVFA
jgi:hypothetical protein